MTTTVAEPIAAAPAVPVLARKLRAPITLGAVGLLSLLFLGFGTSSGEETTFAVARSTDFFQIPTWTVPSQPTAILLSVVALLASEMLVRRSHGRRAHVL